MYRWFGNNPDLYAVAGLATIGWLLTNMNNIRNAENEQTYDILQKIRLDPIVEKHRWNIFSKLGYDTKLSKAMLEELIDDRTTCRDWATNTPAIESLDLLANFYNNIAFHIRKQKVDYTTIENVATERILEFCQDYIIYIKYRNHKNPQALEHLVWLAKKWGGQDFIARWAELAPAEPASEAA
jgi:hypothetical protein